MRTMPAHSVNVVVTSPRHNLSECPHGLHDDDITRRIQSFSWQDQVAAEIARVMRPDGNLFLVVGSNSGQEAAGWRC